MISRLTSKVFHGSSGWSSGCKFGIVNFSSSSIVFRLLSLQHMVRPNTPAESLTLLTQQQHSPPTNPGLAWLSEAGTQRQVVGTTLGFFSKSLMRPRRKSFSRAVSLLFCQRCIVSQSFAHYRLKFPGECICLLFHRTHLSLRR